MTVFYIRVVPDNNYPMNMIWHNYKFIQNNIGIMIWQIIPAIFNDFARFRQYHFALKNFTKYRYPFLCAYGYKINAIPGIIISLQTCRINTVFISEPIHYK